MLTSTAFLPLCGNIADILGRHTALFGHILPTIDFFSHCRSSRQIGFVVFFLGSVLSTAAQNMPMLLAGRGLSGVGAAFLLVVSALSLSACNASSLFRLLARLSVLYFQTIALSLLMQ